MKVMTERQKEVLAFIRDCIDDHGIPPSHREIQEYFGFKSKSAVAKHLAALEAKKKITVTPRRSRAIKLVEAMV